MISTKPGPETTTAHLFAQTKALGEHHALYALVDGAHAAFIHRRILLSGGTYRCLYRGRLSDPVQEIAPYLVLLKPEKNKTDWIIEEGVPRHWAAFFASAHPIDFLQNHLRKFLMVRREDGQKLYFRFYDPRVIALISQSEVLEALCAPGLVFLNPVPSQNPLSA